MIMLNNFFRPVKRRRTTATELPPVSQGQMFNSIYQNQISQ